jgi:cytochrome P450
LVRAAHVPAGLVREFDLDFRGPLDGLFTRMDALRKEGRVFWLESGLPGMFGAGSGAWFFTDAEDIRTALQSPDLFSSKLGELTDSGVSMIPIFLDPPDHTMYRKLLNPLFAPGVVATMENGIRARIRAILDGIAERGSCDFVPEVAIQFPTRVFTSWMGLPEEETEKFVALVSALIHSGDDDETRMAAVGDAFMVLNQLIADRSEAPGDDLMSQIIALEVDGRPLTEDELFRIAFLLFLAGLDTVAAALSFSFWHLAQTPGDRKAISTGAVSAAQAVEELLRRHSFVNLPRVVARDAEFAGVQLKKGDPVVLSLAMASRDPQDYDDPTSVHLERGTKRHFAFGLGPHLCLGNHLARVEMRIALEEWHARIPDYELDGNAGAYAGVVMGVTSLPLRWTH